MQTYPVDADYPPPEQTEIPLAPSPTFADLTEKLVINTEAVVNKKKSQKKQKTVIKYFFIRLSKATYQTFNKFR